MVKERQCMSGEKRAKQFTPFAALTGLDDRTAAAAFMPEERIVLAPESLAELDRAICGLCKGDYISVRYYSRGRYIEQEGWVQKFDIISRTIILDETRVLLDDIVELTKM
ncbi:MAG: YolD-like family protein [Eubacterium sp.]|nr:YolD-like family protein [Eubacterium sp.]